MSLKTALRRIKKKGLYYDIRSYRRFRKKLVVLSKNCPPKAMPVGQVIRTIRNWGVIGYLFNRYYMAHAECSVAEYVPENFYSWYLLSALNPKTTAHRVGDKRMLEILYPGTSPTFLIKSDGRWLSSEQAIDDAEAERILLEHLPSTVVLKKPDSARGQDIYIFSEGESAELLDKARKLPDLCVQDYIHQDQALAVFHPASVNTIRVLTINFMGDIRILGAFVRFGVGDCVVDNVEAGGLCVHLDQYGLAAGPAIQKDGRSFTHHPDSEQAFSSLVVQHWSVLEEQVTELHRMTPDVGFIGWDFAVGEDRFWLLECNTGHPSLLYHQYQQAPLFGDMLPDLFRAVTGRAFLR